MKFLLPLILLTISLSLNANEFTYIQPISIENAPVKKVVEPEPVEEVVVEETNTQEVKKDSDEDGVVDSQDECPDTNKDFQVDGFGCPQTATLKVHFDTNKYNVSKELINDLEKFAEFLKENPGYDVIIYGYTDSSGNKEANKILSKNRANSVKEALVLYDISKLRLTAIGKGEANPMADNETKEGRAQNRRIEVELLQ